MEEEQSRGSATSFEDQEILRGAGGMSWPRKKLELLAADEPYSFVGGPFGSKLTSRDYSDQGIPVIRGSNLNNGRFLDMNEFVYVSDSKVRKDLSGNLAKPGDLVFTQRGTLGQVAIIPKEGISDRYVVSQSQMKLTVDDTKADQFFLYYYFSSREVIDRITNFTSSSGVPHINLTVLRNFEIPVPPLEIQKSIASILSAYDDLIENNRRRIQLLEQAARLLYKEWFVRLRFPGHEHVRVMDGVPEGWAKGIIADLGKIITGKTPSTKTPENFGGNIPFVKTPDMHRSRIIVETEEYLSEKGAATQSNKTLPMGTILVACIGAKLGVVSITCLPCQTNQQINAVVPRKDYLTHYSLFALTDIKPRLEAMGGGATMPNVSKTKFASIPVLIPPQIILQEFDGYAKILFQQIQLLNRQNSCLIRGRDLLLPRLMNGEIAV
ncbi:restriction endonuclease subunit S [Methanothrix soehngenii]|uniref:restriction endonuclease subunit S n=1 Tax=Methanothrix soehngenii TaxID=2223 RepID=UPI002B8B7797|nr:restriction endonuclease subunit S [Methanothrix soehngenii]HOS21518.1 restriction endonuclease subunit S [Methanothrix soehngenii]HPL19990.1 restriction endonuclease subunit S [Methanothrix soehngenii]